MHRKLLAIAIPALMVSLLTGQDRGVKKSRIDVENYVINAEVNPHTQALNATVVVRFLPLDNDISSVSFELNNALNVSSVVDDAGHRDSGIAVRPGFQSAAQLPGSLGEGQADHAHVHLRRASHWRGRFAGLRDQIRSHSERVRLSDVSGEVVPINDYTIDRYTADMHITVPSAFKVIAGGLETEKAQADKKVYTFQFSKPSFPGSIALVQGDPQRVSSQGVTTSVYFRTKQSMASAYGDETGKVMTFLTGLYGLAPQANLTLVETEDGTPNGYSAPGVVFLSPRGIGNTAGSRLLANELRASGGARWCRPSTAITCGSRTGMPVTPSCCGKSKPTGRRPLKTLCTIPTSMP